MSAMVGRLQDAVVGAGAESLLGHGHARAGVRSRGIHRRRGCGGRICELQ